MVTDFKEIQKSALSLDEKTRAELAKRLIYSLDYQDEMDNEQLWNDSINRRRTEVETGVVKPILGQDVHNIAKKLLKK